jgi:hypothetical protein
MCDELVENHNKTKHAQIWYMVRSAKKREAGGCMHYAAAPRQKWPPTLSIYGMLAAELNTMCHLRHGVALPLRDWVHEAYQTATRTRLPALRRVRTGTPASTSLDVHRHHSKHEKRRHGMRVVQLGLPSSGMQQCTSRSAHRVVPRARLCWCLSVGCLPSVLSCARRTPYR